jgi:tryptophan 2,3-dioxygenase
MDKRYPDTYYSDYLQLGRLLECQQRKSESYGSPAHDEMLFIIVHQAYELWFKQILFEIDSVREIFGGDSVEEKRIGLAVARLLRVTEIQKILIDQLRVLETMTPLDFLDFRDFLFPASGFQSVQFRMIEIKLGLLSARRLKYDEAPYHSRLSGEHRERLFDLESETSLFDLVERWLERMPFLEEEGFRFRERYGGAVVRMLEGDRDLIRTHSTLSAREKELQLEELDRTLASFESLLDPDRHGSLQEKGRWRLSHRATLAALFITAYRDEPLLHMPYRLLDCLVDVDELFTTWRYRHALMVHRMIGAKIGTGGSSGYHYLKSTAETHRIFSDLTNLSTYLLPRAALPRLPDELLKKLAFVYRP